MFTVKQLSKLAGVTPRTLHHYDNIGLLKPSRIGANGYRYYGEEALLKLQQILFYRELDFPLDDIKKIIGRRDFDVLGALYSHRDSLQKQSSRLNRLLATVDNTIQHIKGEKLMSNNQLFEAFSDEQQAEYENEVMQKYDPATVKASVKKWRSYTDAEKQRIGSEGNAIYMDFVNVISKGAESPVAQACVERWRQHIEYFWIPKDEQLLGLAKGYNDDSRFKANFDKIHPRLAEFILEAVIVYIAKRKR
jgi:DNA-binding transcriptional MerR regulator